MTPFEPHAEASRPLLELLKSREGMSLEARMIAAAPPVDETTIRLGEAVNRILNDLRGRLE